MAAVKRLAPLVALILVSCARKPDYILLWPPEGESSPVTVWRENVPLRASVPFLVLWRFEGEVPPWPEWNGEPGTLEPVTPPLVTDHEIRLVLEPHRAGMLTLPEREFFFEERMEIRTIPSLELEIASNLPEGEEEPAYSDPPAPSPVLLFLLTHRTLLAWGLMAAVVLGIGTVLVVRVFKKRKRSPPPWKRPLDELAVFLSDPPGRDRAWHRELLERIAVLETLLPVSVDEDARATDAALVEERLGFSRSLYCPPERWESDPVSLHDYGKRCLERFRARSLS